MKTFELQPVNGRKSFNGKCRVINTSNCLTLQSYNTNVATFKDGILWVTKDPKHLTKTTLSHINAFLDFI